MTLQTDLDRAVRDENANPQGLPADILRDMETAIRADRERYPELNNLLEDERKA